MRTRLALSALIALLLLPLLLLLRTEPADAGDASKRPFEIYGERRALYPKPREEAVEETPVAIPEAPPPIEWTPAPREVTPPGTVFLEERETVVGLDRERALELILESGKVSIWSETPEHTVEVDDLYMMVTEVTNEQYAEFVRATEEKPPDHWGKTAIDRAQNAFHQEQQDEREWAILAGETPPERTLFEPDVWWALNWEVHDWVLPQDSERLPVTFVSRTQAEAYAAWAGLRLPTEQEYQRAARRGTRDLYPWGTEWIADRTRTVGFLRGAVPVASEPSGATDEWVFDLAGNVCEWTASSFIPFEGYRPDRIEILESGRARHIDLLCNFDPNVGVVVGGSFLNDAIGHRATTRSPVPRFRVSDAIGFRCVASTVTGLDALKRAWSTDVARSVRKDLDLDFDRIVAVDRWAARETPNAPRGYAVISGYDVLGFAPAVNLGPRSANVVLGLLHATLEGLDPPLPAGTYVLEWRPSDDRVHFRDGKGISICSRPCEPPREDVSPASITFTRAEDRDVARLDLPLRDGWTELRFALELAYEPGALDGNWRR